LKGIELETSSCLFLFYIVPGLRQVDEVWEREFWKNLPNFADKLFSSVARHSNFQTEMNISFNIN
jgi:hypothetical protein